MAEAIRMPLLSDTMKEGIIAEWHKKVGDTVKADDVIAEVETDKATMEVMPYVDGTLLYISEKGKGVPINGIMAIIGKPGEDIQAILNAEGSKVAASAPPPAKDAPKTAPEPAESGVKSAAAPAKDATPQPADKEPAKETQPQAADGTPTPETPQPAATKPAEQPHDESDERLKASPLAKKLAEDKGIDIQQVKGSGDGGRIIKRDVDSFKPASVKSTTEQQAPAFKAQPQTGSDYTDIPLTQMRRIIAQKLTESKHNSPHFYLRVTINMDTAIAARKAMNDFSPVKISFNDLVIKACAMALRKHPAVNSSWMGDFIRQNHNINIGTAVAVEEGLIVPVIKFADQKSLSQIAEEAGILIEKARNKKIQPPEFTGNTFTISNLGMMDMDEFTAIINPPDSCILAVGKIAPTPVAENNTVVIRQLMKLTLSCDHRVVDGAKGAAFMQTLKVLLENPATMLV